MKIISWNVNGIRAAVKKGFFEFFDKEAPEVLCLQETKASYDQLPKSITEYKNYNSFWSSPKEQKGYSGVAVYINVDFIDVGEMNDDPVMGNEGRIIKIEFRDFYLFNVYFPNGGRGEDRLNYKLKFYDEFLDVINKHRIKKPVIFCGDINTAHKEIDLARPKENVNTSGFMEIERAWIDKIVKSGYVDCFRKFHSEPGQYTWWDMKSKARERNIGWRIDYFFASAELESKVRDCYHLQDQMGSDHCPVVLELDIEYPSKARIQTAINQLTNDSTAIL